MGILNPVAANLAVAEGVTQLVYTCPGTKSHAILDLSFYKDNVAVDAMVQVAISTSPAGSLTSVDYFIDDLGLIGTNKNAELTKVVVGTGESVYVKVVTGAVSVRVTGMEELNTKVAAAGRLAAGNIAAASTQTKAFSTAAVGAAYSTISATVFNTHATNSANVKIWVSSSVTPAQVDLLVDTTVLANDTIIIENIMLLPNESLFVQTDQTNSEWFVNGFVVLS